jgi:hypothetical protein
VIDERAVYEHASWVGDLGLSLDFRLDATAATMRMIVPGVGVLTLLYAWQYFAVDTPDLARLAGLLVLFAGAMVGLVQADHLILLYTCWELTSVTSYLLIGNRYTDDDARAAALHALLVGVLLILLGTAINLAGVNDITSVALAGIFHILASPPASNMVSRAVYLPRTNPPVSTSSTKAPSPWGFSSHEQHPITRACFIRPIVGYPKDGETAKSVGALRRRSVLVAGLLRVCYSVSVFPARYRSSMPVISSTRCVAPLAPSINN